MFFLLVEELFAFPNAVRKQLVADVPIGVFLSGGGAYAAGSGDAAYFSLTDSTISENTIDLNEAFQISSAMVAPTLE